MLSSFIMCLQQYGFLSIRLKQSAEIRPRTELTIVNKRHQKPHLQQFLRKYRKYGIKEKAKKHPEGSEKKCTRQHFS